MANTKFNCSECRHLNICKYTKDALDLHEKVHLIEFDSELPFSILLNCNYFQVKVSNPRTRTVGV